MYTFFSCFNVTTNDNDDDNNNDDITTRLWEDLPLDILSSIADNLGLIDLLSFRGVCNSWRASSARATARLESSPGHKPWFLLHGDKSWCLLLNDNDHKRYINIPELEGSTCIASNNGWLLLFKQGSIFFFSPFSRSRIDLPELPISHVPDHIVAVSSPLTSRDCIVCVPKRNKASKRFEVMMISRGEYQWTKHESGNEVKKLSNIICATCYDGVFYFRDNRNVLVTFSPRDEKWVSYRVINHDKVTNNTFTIPFMQSKRYAKDWKKHTKDWLGSEDDFSVSTCGTLVQNDRLDTCIENEICYPEGLDRSRVRGIWFHPRFFQVPRHQTW